MNAELVKQISGAVTPRKDQLFAIDPFQDREQMFYDVDSSKERFVPAVIAQSSLSLGIITAASFLSVSIVGGLIPLLVGATAAVYSFIHGICSYTADTKIVKQPSHYRNSVEQYILYGNPYSAYSFTPDLDRRVARFRNDGGVAKHTKMPSFWRVLNPMRLFRMEILSQYTVSNREEGTFTIVTNRGSFWKASHRVDSYLTDRAVFNRTLEGLGK